MIKETENDQEHLISNKLHTLRMTEKLQRLEEASW